METTTTPETSTPETDYSQLIITDATPVEAPATEPEVAEPVAETIDGVPDTDKQPPAKADMQDETASKAAEVPGTPDKWRQRVDQRMSEIEKLVAKKEEGTITPKEEARLEVKKDELAEILEKGELADPMTAKRVMEVDKRSQDDVSELRKELAELKSSQRETERREIWRGERDKYPGVDVEGTVWPNAAIDATDQVRKEIKLSGMADQFDEATVQKMCYARTRVLYEQRAADAVKSVKARGIPSKTTAPSTPSKPTPNGARVTVTGSAAGVPKASNPNEITDTDYGNLIVHD